MEFTYKVIDSSGKMQKGAVSADSQAEAVESLRKKGLSILELVNTSSRHAENAPRPSFEPFGLSDKTVGFFTQQLAALLEAGISLVQCCNSLYKQTSSPHLQKILIHLSTDLQKGDSITDAFGKHPSAFDRMYMSMIQVGEATGNLPAMVSKLSAYIDKDLEIKQKVKSAMAYPTFVLTFSLLLVYAMVAFLLPGFAPIFTASGLNLKRDYPLTVLLMTMSDLFRNPTSVAIGVVVLIALYIMLRFAFKLKQMQNAWDKVVFFMPIIGGYVRLAIMTRVANSFGALIASGLPMVKCLDLVADSATNSVVGAALHKVSREVQAGNDLGSTFDKAGVFPPLMIQMVAIGEESGSLEKMFPRIAKYYDDQLNAALAGISAVIEPLAMVVVGSIVFVFVLGVLLPILGIAFSVQNQI